MEFWGTEVAPGKPQVNTPGDETYCHVSQVALGPTKDAKPERVVIRVETDGKNIVLGTLVSGKVDQMALDLIFDRDFTLSHTSTSSSVFFCGYKTDKGQEYSDDESDEDEEDEEEGNDEQVPTAVPIKQNGTVSAKEGVKSEKKLAKVIESVAEGKSKKADPMKANLIDEEAVEDEDSDEDDDDDEEEEGAVVKMDFDSDDYDEEDDSEFEVDDVSGSDAESDDLDEEDSDEEDSDEDDEDDEKKEDVPAELGKKRTLQGSDRKSPQAGGKKARVDTPAKPGLITTPAKKAKGAAEAKVTPVSSAKKSETKAAKTPQKTPAKETVVKTPKTTSPGGESAKKLGEHFCADCKRNFASESALSQHSVAKHKK